MNKIDTKTNNNNKKTHKKRELLLYPRQGFKIWSGKNWHICQNK